MSSTFNETLHPRGQAGNAGQFREKTNDAPTGELAGGEDLDVVELTIEVGWLERDHIPPRARKPRDTFLSEPLTLTIPSVSSEDAPVGFTVPGASYADVDGSMELVDTSTDVRVHDGHLFRKVDTRGRDLSEVIFYAAGDGRVNFGEHSFASASEQAEKTAARFVLIDGEPWERTGEPVYTITTMGLGGNRGATLLNAELLYDGQYADGPHAAPEQVFPADQLHAAIDAATDLAKRRGDTDSVEYIRATVPIRITGDFTPGTSFRAAPRIEYTRPPALAWTEEDREAARAGFEDYKRKLIDVPGAVVEVSDGWGGTTRTLDRKVLTEQQGYDYDSYCRIFGLPVVGAR